MPTDDPKKYRDPNYMHPAKGIKVAEAPTDAPTPPEQNLSAILAALIHHMSPENLTVHVPFELIVPWNERDATVRTTFNEEAMTLELKVVQRVD
jgi:hypothetical protein